MEKYKVLGIQIDALEKSVLLSLIADWLSGSSFHWIITANPEIVLRGQRNLEYGQIMNSADLRVADGIGLIYAIKCLYQSRISRLIGADLVKDLACLAEQKNCSIYFLGGREGVAEAAAKKLQEKFTNLKVAGADHGGRAPEIYNDQRVVEEINACQPDIVLVALGAPSQEIWIFKNKDKMPSVKLAIGVGGTFDFLAGKIKRAPLAWQKLGLEWLWRLIQEPSRIGRIFNATIIFSWQVLKQRFFLKNNQ